MCKGFFEVPGKPGVYWEKVSLGKCCVVLETHGEKIAKFS